MITKCCEDCGLIKDVELTPSMTMYHWDGQGEDPNRSVWLCMECKEEHIAYWTERWDEYKSSQGF